MKDLLQRLSIERDAYIGEHRKSPTIQLTSTKGERLLGLLVDVGSDFIEISGFYTGSPSKMIARSQIATVELLADKHQHPR